jgi:oligopeptide/dipeptide ABC transporter ATP-binding protein
LSPVTFLKGRHELVEEHGELVKIEHLKKYFPIKGKGMLHAVDDISFTVRKGETLGLVGESGCGKSTVGNLIMRLLSATEGSISYEDTDILGTGKARQKNFCKKIQIVFQDPYSSLNPKKPVGKILAEPFVIHKLAKGRKLARSIDRICAMTGIEKDMLRKYPHELDGGKRQIVGIARALALEPEFIVCDEPVSALDVSIQAKIINLLIDLQKELGLAYLFISHDLSVVRHISDRVAVMYLGKIVEIAETDTIFERPIHPYTNALLSAVLTADFNARRKHIVLKGDVPTPINPKPGCRFAPRCFMAQEKCRAELPELCDAGNGHFAACHYSVEVTDKVRELEHSVPGIAGNKT